MISNILQFGRDIVAQPISVLGSQIAEPAVLRPRPYQFVWIEFRGIRRQAFGDNVRMLGEESSHQCGAIVNAAAVPQNGQRAAQVRFQVTQVGHDVFARDVGVVRQQTEMKIQLAVYRTDADTADRRDAVAPIPGVQDGRLTPWPPGAADRGRQEKAGFIEKNQVSLAAPGRLRDAGKLLGLPAANGLLIALFGAATWLLHGPTQALT